MNGKYMNVYNKENKKMRVKQLTWFRIGDKIILTQNNYEDEEYPQYNGDIAYITEWFEKNGEQCVKITYDKQGKWEDKEFIYSVKELNAMFQLAYSLTTHKFQGSQIFKVMYVMNGSGYIITRTNQRKPQLFTGITRGQKECHVVSIKPNKAFSWVKYVTMEDYSCNSKLFDKYENDDEILNAGPPITIYNDSDEESDDEETYNYNTYYNDDESDEDIYYYSDGL